MGQPRPAWPVLGALAWVGCQFPDYAYRDVAAAGGNDAAGSSNASGAVETGGGAVGGESTGGTAGDVNIAGGASAGADNGGATNGGALGAAGAAGSDENVVLSDDFESGSGQWLAVAGTGWAVVDDATQGKVYTQTPLLDGFYAAVAKSGPWKDQIIEAKVKISKFGGSATNDVAQVFGRFVDIDNYYSAGFRSDGRVAIRGSVAGSVASIKTSDDIQIKTGVWYSLRFSLIGDVLRLYVDDVVRAEAVDSRITQGTVALGGDNTVALFDDVRVTLP